MIRPTANNRSSLLAILAGRSSMARMPWMGAIIVMLITLLHPQSALATCGDYLQHREGRMPHFAGASQSLASHLLPVESIPTEPSCRSGQCRSGLPAPVVPSDFLTKLSRLRDSFDTVLFRGDWSEDGQEGMLRVPLCSLSVRPILEVPVPPPRASFCS